MSSQKCEGHIHDRVGIMKMCIICNDYDTYNETWERRNGLYEYYPGN